MTISMAENGHLCGSCLLFKMSIEATGMVTKCSCYFIPTDYGHIKQGSRLVLLVLKLCYMVVCFSFKAIFIHYCCHYMLSITHILYLGSGTWTDLFMRLSMNACTISMADKSAIKEGIHIAPFITAYFQGTIESLLLKRFISLFDKI